jgi:zinc transport system substrate-binding protein
LGWWVVVLGVALAGGVQAASVRVTTTVFAYYDLVRAVGGARVEAEILIPPQTSPHEYDPPAAARLKVAKSRLLLMNGLGLDDWAEKLADPARTQVLKLGELVAATKPAPGLDEVGATSRPAATAGEHKHEDGHQHGDPQRDPHVWMNPENQITLAGVVAAELTKLDPAGKEIYAQQLAAYVATLRKLDAEFAAAVKGFKTRKFIGFHPAYAHLAARYGLEQVASVELVAEQGMTPAQAQKIVALVKEFQIKVIFIETALGAKDAELLRKQTGVQLLILQPLETYEAATDTYEAMMRGNLANLKKAME